MVNIINKGECVKNIFIVIAMILCLTFFTKNEAQALVVGDEIIAGKSYGAIPFAKYQLAGVTEFVLDKELEQDTGSDKIDIDGYRVLLKATVSPSANVDIYGRVGLGKDKLDDSANSLKIESDTGTAFGGGFKANLKTFDDMGVYLGMDAQCMRFDASIDTVDTSTANYDSASGDFTVDQWQVAFFLVKDLFKTALYGGVYYADSSVKYDYDTSGISGSGEGENVDSFGILAGININITDIVLFFAEGHFIDETSISVGLNARF